MSWCWDLFSPFFCKEQFTNSYTCLAPIFIFIDFLTLFGLTIIRISYVLFFVILECVVYAQTGLEGPSCREGQARFPQAWRALGQVCWQHRDKKKKRQPHMIWSYGLGQRRKVLDGYIFTILNYILQWTQCEIFIRYKTKY